MNWCHLLLFTLIVSSVAGLIVASAIYMSIDENKKVINCTVIEGSRGECYLADGKNIGDRQSCTLVNHVIPCYVYTQNSETSVTTDVGKAKRANYSNLFSAIVTFSVVAGVFILIHVGIYFFGPKEKKEVYVQI
jgi:hypothetical protein